MSDQKLIRALQDLVARHSPPADSRWLSHEIVSRDRWRVGLLTVLTVLFWLGGIAGVLYMVFCFNRFIVAYSGTDPADLKALKDSYSINDRKEWEFHAKMELHHSLEACMVAVPALLLAALGTIWLVFSSRRATLNQIQISLAGISDQLCQMRQPNGPPDGI